MNRVLVGLIAIILVTAPAAAADVVADRDGAAGQRGQGNSTLQARQRFVLEVVRAAVALPQPDPQDRLRVLHSAASVVAPVAPKLARRLTGEGARLEAELINSGLTPAVSMLATGRADCVAAVRFVDSIPPAAVARAEGSLVSAITLCPQQVAASARVKVETALADGVVAARPLMALMDLSGINSRWSQAQFARMFASLPGQSKEATNFAAMFVRVAPAMDKDVARDAGLKFLEWLASQKQTGERNLAVTMTTDTLKKLLGEKDYQQALSSNVLAQSAARTAGQPGRVEHPEEERTSVLEAMGNTGRDRSDVIRELAPSRRAREAAAHGFASGTNGDRKTAERYFDIAFSAVDEVWAQRSPQAGAPAVVEEVSEAAAHVDAVAALQRAQRLQDPSAQAISMLAVARVVVGQE